MRAVCATIPLYTLGSASDIEPFLPNSHECANQPFRLYVSYLAVTGSFSRQVVDTYSSTPAFQLWFMRSRAALDPDIYDMALFACIPSWMSFDSTSKLQFGKLDISIPVGLLLDVNEVLRLSYSEGSADNAYVYASAGGYLLEGPDLDIPEAQQISMCQPIIPFMKGRGWCFS